MKLEAGLIARISENPLFIGPTSYDEEVEARLISKRLGVDESGCELWDVLIVGDSLDGVTARRVHPDMVCR